MMKLSVPAAGQAWASTIAAPAASPAPCYEARLFTIKGALSEAKGLGECHWTGTFYAVLYEVGHTYSLLLQSFLQLLNVSIRANYCY